MSSNLFHQQLLRVFSVWINLLAVLTAQHIQIPNVGHYYPVHIGAQDHIVQGRVSSEAEPGALVPSDVIQEGDQEADSTIHLRVEVRSSVYKRLHVFNPYSGNNSSGVEDFPNSTLPYGIKFVVVHTNAFYINEDRYITVNDFSALNGETRIHFDVILKDDLAEMKYISNQLRFVVEIDYPKRDLNPNAVLFAGVLVLTIVAISLLIPFVVRAKRRCKAGKPIFGCGSADDSLEDSDSFGLGPDYLKKRTYSIGGKDNLAMILDNGGMVLERSNADQHLTIQNHALRSTSSFHFQPRCLDPHYNDAYERPDYAQFQPISSPPTKTSADQSEDSSERTSCACCEDRTHWNQSGSTRNDRSSEPRLFIPSGSNRRNNVVVEDVSLFGKMREQREDASRTGVEWQIGASSSGTQISESEVLARPNITLEAVDSPTEVRTQTPKEQSSVPLTPHTPMVKSTPPAQHTSVTIEKF